MKKDLNSDKPIPTAIFRDTEEHVDDGSRAREYEYYDDSPPREHSDSGCSGGCAEWFGGITMALVITMGVIAKLLPDSFAILADGFFSVLFGQASLGREIPGFAILGDFFSSPLLPSGITTADIAVLVLCGFALLIPLLFRVFRKRHNVVSAVEQTPPVGINPAEMGYIIDGHISAEDMTSLIYYWASHGHISVEPRGEVDFNITWLSDLDGKHKAYERELFERLWVRNIPTIRKKSYSFTSEDEQFHVPVKKSSKDTPVTSLDHMNEAFSGAYRQMRSLVNDKYDFISYRSSTVATFLPLLIVLASMLFPLIYLPLAARTAFSFSFLFFSFIISASIWMKFTPLELWSDPEENIIKRYGLLLAPFTVLMAIPVITSGISVINLLPVAVSFLYFLVTGLFEKAYVLRNLGTKRYRRCRAWGFAAGIAAAVLYTVAFSSTALSIALTFLLGLCTVIGLSLCPDIRAISKEGAELRSRCLSYRHFLVTAEKERLEMLINENPGYYYESLAYARVLGVSDIWAEKTDGLNIDLPSWFSSDYTDTNAITQSLMGFMDSIALRAKASKRKRIRKKEAKQAERSSLQ